MAYTDQKMSGGKITAIVIVAVIHLALGYAFITGLAYQYVKKAQEKMTIVDVDEPPPPPPEVPPPPPPPDQPQTPPPPTTVVSPPPIVQTPVQTPPMQTSPVIPPSQPTAPPAPPAPPSPPAPPAAPPAPVRSQAATSKGDPHGWFSTDDYPDAALRAEASGRVQARLTIGTDGRVSGCSVTASSGNSALDSATCRVAQRKGRYSPAKDQNGNPISDTATISIRWEVPKD